MVGDGAVRISACEAAFDQLGKRHPPIAVLGVHLQVALVVAQAESTVLLETQHLGHLRAAEEVAAPLAPARDVGGPGAFADRLLDDLGAPGLKKLVDDA